MQPTADFDAARLARSLLRRSRQGALATLMAGSGDPYCSLVNVASHADGSPILLISRLALHTKNILGRPQGLADAGRARRGRSAGGRADHAGGPGRGGRGRDCRLLRRRYLNAHPSAEAFVDFKDFSFFRIAPSGLHLVAGFGRIVDLEPDAVSDRYRRCRRAAGGRAGRDRAHERGSSRGDEPLCDRSCWAPRPPTGAAPAATPTASTCRPAATTLRLDFPERVTSGLELRKMLVRLAGEARAKI